MSLKEQMNMKRRSFLLIPFVLGLTNKTKWQYWNGDKWINGSSNRVGEWIHDVKTKQNEPVKLIRKLK